MASTFTVYQVLNSMTPSENCLHENLVFHGRIYVIFISAFLPVSEDLDVLLFLDPAANLISIHPT